MARRDDDEFAAFAEACSPALWRTAYLICGDWDRAADITQEALIRMYVAWPRLDRDPWLRAYARRAVVTRGHRPGTEAVEHRGRLVGHPRIGRSADP